MLFVGDQRHFINLHLWSVTTASSGRGRDTPSRNWLLGCARGRQRAVPQRRYRSYLHELRPRSSSGSCCKSLKGSGLISGKALRAYHNNLTITPDTARFVGNGAYHVHLGECAVQVEGQPIILTGAFALDKALGREVYTSHLTSATDPEEVIHVLRVFALPSTPPHVCPLPAQWS